MLIQIFALSFHTIIFEYSYQALLLILMLSGPPIIIASVLGLFVAIIQAATQIQEQTFAFTIKMVSVIGTILLMGGWLGALIRQFALQIFQHIDQLKV